MLLQVLLTLTIVAGPSLAHGAVRSVCSKIDQCEYAMKLNGKRYSTLRFLMPVAEEIPHLCPGEQSSYASCMTGIDTSACFKKHVQYSDRFIRLQFQTICDNVDQIKDDVCSKDEPERLKFSQRVETNCQAIFNTFYKKRYSATDKMFDDTATKLMDCIIGSVTPCGEAYKTFYEDIKHAFGNDAKENYHYASSMFIDVKTPSLFSRIGVNPKKQLYSIFG